MGSLLPGEISEIQSFVNAFEAMSNKRKLAFIRSLKVQKKIKMMANGQLEWLAEVQRMESEIMVKVSKLWESVEEMEEAQKALIDLSEFVRQG